MLLSKILYQQKQALPRLQKMDKNLADEIADIRLYQFEINQQRELISNPTTYVNNLLATQPPDQARLGSAVIDLAAITDQTGHRGNAHNAPGLAAADHRHHDPRVQGR